MKTLVHVTPSGWEILEEQDLREARLVGYRVRRPKDNVVAEPVFPSVEWAAAVAEEGSLSFDPFEGLV